MADKLADGRLREILAEHVANKTTGDAICRQLFADFGIEVTRQTISNWVNRLGLDPVEAASA